MKKIFIILILVTGSLLVGCGKEEDNKKGNTANNNVVEQSKDGEESETGGALDADDESNNKDKTSNKNPSESVDKENEKPVEEVKNKVIPINLYLYDVAGDKWITQESSVNTGRIKDLVIELRNNPLVGLPKNTKIYSLTIKDKIATVDVGKEFLDPQTCTSAATTAKVESIVNTLCLNKELGIEGVMFLIEGKRVNAIGPLVGTDILRPTI